MAIIDLVITAILIFVKRSKADMKLNIKKLSLLLPALFLFSVFTLYPFFSGIYYSFTEWDGINSPVFIGFGNYIRLFTEQGLKQSFINTMIFCLVTMLVSNTISIFLAVCLSEPLKTRGALRTIFYIPCIISLMAVSVIWGNILNYDGLLNGVLKFIGLSSIMKDWISNMGTALLSLIAISIWSGVGFGTVIYLAGIESIPKEMYESAKIDGVNAWEKFSHITLPLLMPSVTICTFLGLTGSLKIFDLPYIMTKGGPGDATSTIALFIYNQAFTNYRYGMATAAGILFMFTILVVTFLQLKFTREKEVEF